MASEQRTAVARLSVIDWGEVPALEVKGAMGASFWRLVDEGRFRLRLVEYRRGFVDDHWCRTGHAGLVLEGELGFRFKSGAARQVKARQAFQVEGTPLDPHLVFTTPGALVFFVD